MKKKIKYQGGITKFLSVKRAEKNKREFSKMIQCEGFLHTYNTNKVDLDVISFSGAVSFEDQLLSIYSFVFYAGIPIQWTIYSDKSYTEKHKAIFKDKFPFVVIEDWDVHNYYKDNTFLSDYIKLGNLAKKINIIIGHAHQYQTLYVDSDIIFYKNVSYYINSGLLYKNFWYVPDSLGNIAQYFDGKVDSIYPINSGLLILNDSFRPDDIFVYLEGLKGNYGYFSEQSSFEYAFRKQEAKPLDPRQYIIDTSDQFDFSVKYFPDEIAMRHYTSPVRHKIWQYGWDWHFKYRK